MFDDILFLITCFLFFIQIRLIFCLKTNIILAKEALEDVYEGNDILWFTGSSILNEAFNPIHWNKWTAKQWIKYYKG